jgi:hypothetical protein
MLFTKNSYISESLQAHEGLFHGDAAQELSVNVSEPVRKKGTRKHQFISFNALNLSGFPSSLYLWYKEYPEI